MRNLLYNSWSKLDIFSASHHEFSVFKAVCQVINSLSFTKESGAPLCRLAGFECREHVYDTLIFCPVILRTDLTVMIHQVNWTSVSLAPGPVSSSSVLFPPTQLLSRVSQTRCLSGCVVNSTPFVLASHQGSADTVIIQPEDGRERIANASLSAHTQTRQMKL